MTDGTAQQAAAHRWLGIDWLRTAAGALAAVASAFLLSFLGAAGTILGAALGSLIVTIASAVFTQGLSTSKRTLEKAQQAAARKVGVAQAEVLRAERADDTAAHDSHLEHADERLAQAQRDLAAVSQGGARVPWRERLRAVPWKRVLVAAGGLFVVAILVITVIELTAGRSVSSITGGSGNEGTTIGHVGGRGSSSDDRDDDKGPGPSEKSSPSPSEDGSPSDEQTPDETTPAPTPDESPSPTPGDEATDGPSESPGDLGLEPEAPTSATPEQRVESAVACPGSWGSEQGDREQRASGSQDRGRVGRDGDRGSGAHAAGRGGV